MIRLLSIQPVAERGGSDHALLRLVRSLPSDEFDCHLVLPGVSPLTSEYHGAGATLHTVPMARISGGHGAREWAGYAGGWPLAVGRITRLARQLGADVIHSNSLHSWYGWAAAAALRRPHVWHAREIVVQSAAALRLERVLTRRFATEVVCMSQAIADQLDARRLVVIRETVDEQEYRPDRAGAFRARVGIPDDVPLVGAAGRLDTWKGFAVLLDAFEQARLRRPEIHLVVAGGPVVGKEAYAEGLARRAAGIEHVHWIGHRSDMAELHADLDLFALASTEPEPYGLVAVEALASGAPIVVTDTGGAAEILERAPAGSGRTVPPDDAGALAEAMAELLPAGSSSAVRRATRLAPTALRDAPILDGLSAGRTVAGPVRAGLASPEPPEGRSMIRLESVTKRFPNGTVAVHELSLEVGAGEICVLVGPSGCGKTTTLKMINRLIEPTDGRLYLDGEDVTGVDPVGLRRRIGYVIQQVGLFPHQTIAANVGTVPRLLGWSRKRVTGARRRAARPRRPRSGHLPRPLPHPALGRPAPASRRRPGAGGRPAGPAHGRALRRHRPRDQGPAPGRVSPAPGRGTQDDRLRDPRHRGGREDGRSHRDPRRRRHPRPVRHPRRGPRQPCVGMVADFVGADRGLKRLKVTPIDPACLEHPPTVQPDDSLADARRTMGETSTTWVAVVDEHGELRGHVRRANSDGDGSVAERVERVEAWVSVDDYLENALAAMLLTDYGWVAVVDGDRFVGVLTPDAIYRALRSSIDDAAVTSNGEATLQSDIARTAPTGGAP